MTFWFFVLGLPLALFGAFALARPAAAARFLVAFPRHAPSGVVLCALGWKKPETLKKLSANANKNMMLVALVFITLIFFIMTEYLLLSIWARGE